MVELCKQINRIAKSDSTVVLGSRLLDNLPGIDEEQAQELL
jgi:hypothetical protein